MNAPVLHLMQGLPASGKTTLARKVIANSARPLRYVGLDALRWMLDSQTPTAWWAEGAEESTACGQAGLVAALLRCGDDVLLDGTHVAPGQVAALREALAGMRLVVVVHTVRTPVDECLARDAERAHRIGEDCIRRLAREWTAATATGWELTGAWLTGLAPGDCLGQEQAREGPSVAA